MMVSNQMIRLYIPGTAKIQNMSEPVIGSIINQAATKTSSKFEGFCPKSQRQVKGKIMILFLLVRPIVKTNTTPVHYPHSLVR